jgi:FtsP/CotA-like multicopper oxidase with cupredoxin domain
VLQLQRGDWLELTLQNRIGPADIRIDGPQESNLHYRGMSVSPMAPGDDVFLHIGAGADYRYRWQVPKRHAQGAHWYHPHAHGLVEPQILSGMSGLLMVDGLMAQHFPAFAALPEKHFLLRDIALPGAADEAPLTKTINGVLGGSFRLRPGEMQVWHVGSVGADAYFDLAIDSVKFWEISRDGNVLRQPRPLDNVFLPPGSRATVLAPAPASPGDYAVRSRAVDTGPQGDPNPQVQLATLRAAGAPVDSTALQGALVLPAVHQDTATPEQLAALPITRRRTITFSETDDGNTFFIDGQVYDLARDDVSVRLGGRGGVDAAQRQRRAARVPHPQDGHPGQVHQQPGYRRDRPARRGRHTVPTGRCAWRGEDRPALRQPGHGRALRVPLPHCRARGRRHDGQHRRAAAGWDGIASCSHAHGCGPAGAGCLAGAAGSRWQPGRCGGETVPEPAFLDDQICRGASSAAGAVDLSRLLR